MGSLSFGVGELKKAPVSGWFKLLTQEEGEFYSSPCIDEASAALIELRNKVKRKSAETVSSKLQSMKSTSNLHKQDIPRPSDFNFRVVLGKGSFGKVSISMLLTYTCDLISLYKYLRCFKAPFKYFIIRKKHSVSGQQTF
ncbi:unnamed protein product [Schistocephalus solidus]|uniref:Protein kinase domain-containing protein n=1 Tax=Schistocephalus solidus TaxID=70667 RepID=A0A183TMU9_SCHSO|nr:unnamed protein product [Schistocephalus solidus]